jgi:hypothetical protein
MGRTGPLSCSLKSSLATFGPLPVRILISPGGCTTRPPGCGMTGPGILGREGPATTIAAEVALAPLSTVMPEVTLPRTYRR